MLWIAEGNDKVPELTNAPKTEITANKAKEDLVATQSVESPEEAQKWFMKGIDSLLNDQDTLANIAGLISEQMSTQWLNEVATAEDIREMMTEFKSWIRFEKQAPKLDYMADNKSIHKNPNQTFAYTPSTNNPPANFGININAGYQVILAETNISNAVIEWKLQFHESRGVNPYLWGKFILWKNPDENFVWTEYNYGRYVDFTWQFGVLWNVMNLTKAWRFQVESDSYVWIWATQANVTIDQERKEEDRWLWASQNKTWVMTFWSNIRLSANPSSLAALKQWWKSRSAAKFFIEW